MIKILAFVLAMFYTTTAQALELLMYHNKNCGYCIAFMEEVYPFYKYDNLPLVIIEQGNEPIWFVEAYVENRIKPLRGTPTFIIWNGRKELTRLYGYGTRENFYERIEQKFKPGYLNEQN